MVCLACWLNHGGLFPCAGLFVQLPLVHFLRFVFLALIN
jgi:hypothetical protein